MKTGRYIKSVPLKAVKEIPSVKKTASLLFSAKLRRPTGISDFYGKRRYSLETYPSAVTLGRVNRSQILHLDKNNETDWSQQEFRQKPIWRSFIQRIAQSIYGRGISAVLCVFSSRTAQNETRILCKNLSESGCRNHNKLYCSVTCRQFCTSKKICLIGM